MLPSPASLIPHRPPFLFLDEVLELDEQHALCARTFRAEEPFYAGHYPGNPLTPGVLLCEAVFQAGAVFLTHRLASQGGSSAESTPVLCRIEEAKFKGMVLPGDRVTIEVRPTETLQQFHFMSGTVRKDGKAVLTLRYALALIPKTA